MGRENTSIVLAERPKDEIIPNQTFNVKKDPAPTPADLKDGEVLAETLYLSLDPAMRGWLNDARSYLPPVQIGAVMRGGGVSRVLASRSKQAAEGDLIFAHSGWTEYAVVPEGAFEPTSRYPGLNEPQEMLSVLGLTALTAWWGVTQIGKPKEGETVVISGAAGATGSIAGQIAKIKGARVIGLAGSDDKCQWLVEERGFDVALNYKADDFKQKFKEATPKFVDVFFDNVGGEILDMALGRAAQNARFIQCGAISQYNTSKPKGPSNMMNIVAMRITMQGFIVTDHAEHFPEARKELSQWVAEGKLKKGEHIIKGGIEAAQQGMIDLFKGVNTGKLMVQVKDPSETPSKL